ncbi:hypothetical protein [Pedobacter alpinus]|uniref:3-oxoacyl-ACP synthase n=1 Tax=Pedobacter alpinus TaxID=1590643 RepID=A0ABW5TRZ6_9SPHI
MIETDWLSIKQQVFEKCDIVLNTKVEELQTDVVQLRLGIANDSKSSMGDKYETSREMMQQEINRLEQQISINKQQLFMLKSSKTVQQSSHITKGSLVETSIGNFLIAASFGELKLKEFSCFVISEAAPIAQLLMGKSNNEQIEINKKQVNILNVY